MYCLRSRYRRIYNFGNPCTLSLIYKQNGQPESTILNDAKDRIFSVIVRLFLLELFDFVLEKMIYLESALETESFCI